MTETLRLIPDHRIANPEETADRRLLVGPLAAEETVEPGRRLAQLAADIGVRSIQPALGTTLGIAARHFHDALGLLGAGLRLVGRLRLLGRHAGSDQKGR